MSQIIKALACPFCGQKPRFRFVPESSARPEIENAYWTLSCSHKNNPCPGPMTFGDSKGEAIERWNVRAPLPSKTPRPSVADNLSEAIVRLLNLTDSAVPCGMKRNHVVASIHIRDARAFVKRIKKGGA